MRIARFLDRLRNDREGAMIIETAIVAPVLVLMSLGAYQVSGIIAKQAELQGAAAEGAAIALAAAPDTVAKRTVLKNVMMASTGLPTGKVTITEAFRCDNSTSFVTNSNSCSSGDVVSKYVKIRLSDTYTPPWTSFGVGSPIQYNVVRYVMYKQQTA